MPSLSEPLAIYYTRCPVPTASGIAFQRQMFDSLFADTSYRVCDLQELGKAHSNAHYTHSIEHFFREGGGAPPIWARSHGVDSVLLGITFMEERLGIYVRKHDCANNLDDMAGRRMALPVWPKLVFNFWRFAAQKGLSAALAVHGMTTGDVSWIDVEEGWNPHERRMVDRSDLHKPARCEYRGQLHALLDGKVDAIFGKGPEAALLEKEGGARIRLLYDVRDAPNLEARVNNSTPRLLTTSRALLDQHPEAVLRYLRTVVRAARWALAEPGAARRLIARECAVAENQIETYLQPGYLEKLLPAFEPELVEAAQIMQAFLLKHGFIEHDFDLEAWSEPDVLRQAYDCELSA